MSDATDSAQFAEFAHAVLEDLFARAKKANEFEYASSLLRVKGIEGPGWDPLQETQHLVDDMVRLINSPLRTDTQVRLALLTYCHLTEADAIYEVLQNMLRTIGGQRCSTDPFWDIHQPVRGKVRSRLIGLRPPSAKTVVNFIKRTARELSLFELCELFDEFFDDQVRNSFFHSDYIIYKNEYRTREAQFIVNRVRRPVLTFEELFPVINRGLAFYSAFTSTYYGSLHAYQESKIVYGQLRGEEHPPVAVELIVEPGVGLIGFRSPPQEKRTT